MRLSIFLAALSFSVPAHAANSACQQQFFQQEPIVSPSIGSQFDLCFSEYDALDSPMTKTPLWSAEHLTPARVTAAKTLIRKNRFHAERQLPASDRANLSDYRGSHYDRGHMSPDDDMDTRQAQTESFSLSNVVPQNACNNEIVWRAIETAVRDYVLTHGDVYVVTGPIFDDPSTTTIGQGVHVPTRLFKAVYDPRTNQMIIVVTPNSNVQTYSTVTVAQLESWTGVNPFPSVVDPAMTLVLPPLPLIRGGCHK